MASLKKNIISLIFLQGSNYIIPLLTLPYLSRTLGVDGFGSYGLTLAIAQYFLIFTDFGFNLTASKKIAENQADKKYISTVFWETIIAKSLLCACSMFIMLLLVLLPTSEIVSKDLLFTYLMVLGTTAMPLWFFQGIEDLSKVTVFSVTSKLLTLPLFYIFVNSELDVGSAVLIQSSINMTSAIIGCFIIYKYQYVQWLRPSVGRVLETIKQSWGVFVATITISVYTLSSSIIISITSDISEVSLFTAGDRIKSAILSFFLVLGNAFFPRVNKLYKFQPAHAYRFLRKIIIYQSGLGILIGATFFVGADWLSVFIYGEDFQGVAPIFMVFSPLFFLVLTSTVFGNYILLPLGYRKEYVALPMLSASIHIPLCFLLSMHYGALGGALSILVVETVTCLTLSYILYRKKILAKLIND